MQTQKRLGIASLACVLQSIYCSVHLIYLNSKVEIKTGTDDWLQEEYEKIKKNQTLATLQLKLDKLKKRDEKFNEMKLRVAKLKTKVSNKKIEFYFQNIDKGRTELSENTENDLEKENEEDRDLILEECEENDEASDGEELEEDKQDDAVKVLNVDID